jgi:hypothetical protein
VGDQGSKLEQSVLNGGLGEVGEASQDHDAADERRGEDGAVPDGVGLQAAGEVSRVSCESNEPENQGGQRDEEQEHLKSLSRAASRVAQPEAVAVRLVVAEGLLDLHARGIELLDASFDAELVLQRCREQPGSPVQFAIHLGVWASGVLVSPSAVSGRVSADQVEAEAVAVPARQDDVADVAGDRRRVLVERIGETPATSLLVQVLDLVSNSSDPVPAHGLDRAEPRSSEAGIGDQDARVGPS